MSCGSANGKERQRAESNGTGDGRRHPGGITEGHFSNDNRAGGGFGETSNFGPSLFKTGPVDPLLVLPGFFPSLPAIHTGCASPGVGLVDTRDCRFYYTKW